jgi:hypothetical protein
MGTFSHTARSTCEFWVNPVNFTFAGRERRSDDHGKSWRMTAEFGQSSAEGSAAPLAMP